MRNQMIRRLVAWATLPVLMVLLSSSIMSAAPADHVLRGRVVIPEYIDPQDITINLYNQSFTEIENDWATTKSLQVGEESLFEITYPATEKTELEFTGPGVRRARFPWPHDMDDDPDQRALFTLEPGAVLLGEIADAESGEPISEALIGPVVPGEEIAREMAEKVYPFFLRSSEDGKIEITGIVPESSYYMHIYAPGYGRRRIHVTPNAPFSVLLRKEGISVSGQVVGMKTLEPVSETVLLLMGGPESFYLMMRGDMEGKFAIDGVPPGNYQIMPVVHSVGAIRPKEITVAAGEPVENLMLYVPEGIEVAGQVVDVETLEPISDVVVKIRESSVTSNEDGEFFFPKIKGPFPVDIEIERTGYKFIPEDQDDDRYPLEGYADEDIAGMQLKIRRERFLKIVRTDSQEDAPVLPGVMEIWGPLEKQDFEKQLERIANLETVIEINGAGTRAALMKATGNFASDLHVIHTDLDETTTTVQTALLPGARIEGSFTYEEEEPASAPSFKAVLIKDFAEIPVEPITLSETRPDGEGKFIMESLPPGTFTLELLRPEGEPYLSEEITLVRGETTEFARTVQRGLILAGSVVDGEGKPLPQITLSAYGFDTMGGALHLQTVTDDEGKFRFEDFGPPEVSLIQISHFHYAPFKISSVSLPREDLVLTLDSRPGIEVTVAAPEEDLHDAHAMILLGRMVSSGSGGAQWFYEPTEREALGGKSTVTLTPRVEGELRVAAEAMGYWDVSPPIQWYGSNMGNMKLTLIPEHTSTVIVEVPGMESEEQTNELEVMLINTSLPEGKAPTEFSVTSVDAGLFTYAEIPAGMYMIVGYDDLGGAATVTNLEVGRGQTVRATLDLSPPEQEIAGLVSYGSGRSPASGARVVVRFGDVAEAQPLMETKADQEGVFFLGPLVEGRPYLVDVEYLGQSQRFPVNPQYGEKTINREFVLLPATTVEWRVGEQLRARMARHPNQPLILQSRETGEVILLRGEEALSAQGSAKPGTYAVNHGEVSIGTVRIPESSDVAVVELPEPG